MKLKVAIQMDPCRPIDIDGDSTFVLALEAQRRGHELCHYMPPELIFRDGKVLARAQPMKLRREKGNHFTLGAAEIVDLATFDVVLLRQDPPFDMAYITTTHLLEHIHPKPWWSTIRPRCATRRRSCSSPHFDELMPPTLITADRARDRARSATSTRTSSSSRSTATAAPACSTSGRTTRTSRSLLEMFTQRCREPVIVQRYLPEVRKGDKRIILIDGKAAGAVNRVPAEGEARSNMHVGGKAVKDTLTRRDHEICEIIGPELHERGLIFVGIDVIGDYLTEINVTSPTGLQQINRFDGVSLEAQIWDRIEVRYQESRRTWP